MNKTCANAVAFIVGAVAGAIVTWKFLEKYYEDRTQEEIDSVKETFSQMRKPVKQDENDISEDDTPQAPHDYKSTVERLDYSTYSSTEEEKVKEPVVRPYTVSAETYENDWLDFEKITLVYFADGILCDEELEPVENPDETVGIESLGKFGEYEDDAVFVINEERHAAYEILRDERKYKNVASGSRLGVL